VVRSQNSPPFPTPYSLLPTPYSLLPIFMKDKFLRWLNFVLVADVFLVLFSFGWLVIAVIGHEASVPLGLNLWYKLWQPVFTPSIGILMVGAITSGIISWISRKLQVRS